MLLSEGMWCGGVVWFEEVVEEGLFVVFGLFWYFGLFGFYVCLNVLLEF